MSRPPEFNEHAAKIKEYIQKLGLHGLVSEIRFAMIESEGKNPDDYTWDILAEITKFQDKLAEIQRNRILTVTRIKSDGTVLPIGVINEARRTSQ